VNLDSAAYYELLQAYIREHSGVWNEEIGEAAPLPRVGAQAPPMMVPPSKRRLRGP
jgi:hypothetical protein